MTTTYAYAMCDEQRAYKSVRCTPLSSCSHKLSPPAYEDQTDKLTSANCNDLYWQTLSINNVSSCLSVDKPLKNLLSRSVLITTISFLFGSLQARKIITCTRKLTTRTKHSISSRRCWRRSACSAFTVRDHVRLWKSSPN